MGRYRGIGMPRPKKKKAEAVEAVEEMPIEEEDQAEEPPPPSPPSKKQSVVAPESPSKTLLQKAQRRARLFVTKAQTHSAKCTKKMERANGLFEAELSVFEAKIKSLERAEKAKKKPSPVGQLQKAHRAETAMQHAHYAHLLAKYDVTLDLVHVIEAQLAATEAKVVRLTRQLRVAKRAKRYRRGWSTTRVRFAV